MCGRKKVSQKWICSDKISFSPAEKPKRKAPIYHSAARETTKSRVKFDKVKLNSQSNPLDNLAKLESVNISFEVMDFGVSLLIKLRQLKAKKSSLKKRKKK